MLVVLENPDENDSMRKSEGRGSGADVIAACGAKRAAGRPVRSYNGDSSKADGDTPNKQRLRDTEGAWMRRKGGRPLNQRSKRTIQKPSAAEGDTVA